ncbi:MAG: UBX domain-containing protein 7 [Marteilia pararefringens]
MPEKALQFWRMSSPEDRADDDGRLNGNVIVVSSDEGEEEAAAAAEANDVQQVHNDGDDDDHHQYGDIERFLPTNFQVDEEWKRLQTYPEFSVAGDEIDFEVPRRFPKRDQDAEIFSEFRTSGTNLMDCSIFETGNWMFKPSRKDMIKEGSFKTAKFLCESKSKWLVLILINENEFSSHALIRDHLNSPEFYEMCETHCIMYMTQETSIMGQHIKQLYDIKSLPLLSIIDPRTGRIKLNFADKLNLKDNLKLMREFFQILPEPGNFKGRAELVTPQNQIAISDHDNNNIE